MSPGPNTTAGMPALAIREASVPKGTEWTVVPAHDGVDDRPEPLDQFPELGWVSGRQPGWALRESEREVDSRIVRGGTHRVGRGRSNVSPGSSRRSRSARQESGTVFG